jgi:thiamine pyrophosphokinase
MKTFPSFHITELSNFYASKFRQLKEAEGFACGVRRSSLYASTKLCDTTRKLSPYDSQMSNVGIPSVAHRYVCETRNLKFRVQTSIHHICCVRKVTLTKSVFDK